MSQGLIAIMLQLHSRLIMVMSMMGIVVESSGRWPLLLITHQDSRR